MEKTQPTTRSIEVRIEIDATPDIVWKALTESAQLESWFPLNARVTPGAGGSVWASWGGASTYESRIEVWEPARHLRLIDQDADPEQGRPVPVAQDYFIEGASGRTVLRFVHSGFSPDTQWDEMYDAMSSGWHYFFLNLKHYAEKHAGVHRIMVWTRHAVARPPADDDWSRVLRGLGIDADARVGDGYTLRLAGQPLAGSVIKRNPPFHFAGTLPDLNDGLLFIEFERGHDAWHLGVWISTYGVPTERTERLQQRLEAAIGDLLPAPAL